MSSQIQFPESWFSRRNPYRILVVDPNRKLASGLARALGEATRIERAGTADTALQMLGLTPFDLLVLQLKLPLFSGVELARRLKKILPELAVLTLAPRGSEDEGAEVVRLGYPHPVTQPDDEEELTTRCREYMAAEEWHLRIEWLMIELRKLYNFDRILSLSPAMTQVHQRLVKVTGSRVPVLITGESGTGKELVARMIHATGENPRRPFVSVNCAAVPEGLLESQFFGHEKGAFTGAHSRQLGRFELASGGTLFLDEIGEMSPALQAKLLRVIEYGEFERVGGSETIKVNVRLITSTNRDLEARVAEGLFRPDLFYRVNVFPIHLPPLRERGDDVCLLAYHFLRRTGQRNNRQIRYIQPDALELLKRYPWPGNIRELENAVERALLLSDGIRLNREDFPLPNAAIPDESDWDAVRPLTEVEREAVIRALKLTGGNVAEAARRLGISLNTVHQRIIEKLDIRPDEKNPEAVRPLTEVEREAIIKAMELTNGNVAVASRRLGVSRNTLYRKLEEHGLSLPTRETVAGSVDNRSGAS